MCLNNLSIKQYLYYAYIPTYMRWELYPLFFKRNNHKDLKWTKLCFGPHLDMYKVLFRLPDKNKNESIHQTDWFNVLSYFWSVAPSSGNFGRRPPRGWASGQDQKFFRKNKLRRLETETLHHCTKYLGPDKNTFQFLRLYASPIRNNSLFLRLNPGTMNKSNTSHTWTIYKIHGTTPCF